MSQKLNVSRLIHLVCISPYFLLLFLVAPVITVVCNLLHVPYPINLLLVSNVAFLICILLRFLWCLTRLWSELRYPAAVSPKGDTLRLAVAPQQLRLQLQQAGYRFDAAGAYAERRDWGFLGLLLLYGALLIGLTVGTWDNMVQMTGAIRTSVGVPLPLDDAKRYQNVALGSWASFKEMPHLLVKRQMLPDAKFPRGAAEVVIISDEGKELAHQALAPGEMLQWGGYRVELTRFTYDAIFAISKNHHILYRNYVPLHPLREKKERFAYHGALPPNADPEFADISGAAWFDPTDETLKVAASRGGVAIVDTELQLRKANSKAQGEYLAMLDGVGSWCELRIFRARHLMLVKACVLIALIGGALRLMSRPQRLWLETDAEGSALRVQGRSTEKLIRELGAR